MFPNYDVNKYGNLMVRLCLQTLIFLGKKFPKETAIAIADCQVDPIRKKEYKKTYNASLKSYEKRKHIPYPILTPKKTKKESVIEQIHKTSVSNKTLNTKQPIVKIKNENDFVTDIQSIVDNFLSENELRRPNIKLIMSLFKSTSSLTKRSLS